MLSQVLEGNRRSKAISGIGAAAVTLASAVLVFQAHSIGSSWEGTKVQFAPAPVAATTNSYAANGPQLPEGCWVKYGCDRRDTSKGVSPSGREGIPDGCMVKFGCKVEPSARRSIASSAQNPNPSQPPSR